MHHLTASNLETCTLVLLHREFPECRPSAECKFYNKSGCKVSWNLTPCWTFFAIQMLNVFIITSILSNHRLTFCCTELHTSASPTSHKHGYSHDRDVFIIYSLIFSVITIILYNLLQVNYILKIDKWTKSITIVLSKWWLLSILYF